MTAVRTTRRRFLGWLGLAAGAAVAGVGVVRWRTSRSLARELVAIFRDTKAAGRVGRAWLESEADEHSLEGVIDRLVADLGVRARLVGRDRLYALVAERVRADYDSGRTVKIGNWVVSRTEARLCALAALLSDDVSGREARFGSPAPR